MTVGSSFEVLITKIDDRNLKTAIFGLGYVGLPLALALSNEFSVFGYDINIEKMNSLKKSISPIPEISGEEVSKNLGSSFFPTSQISDLAKCDVFIICVPTPLKPDKKPDLSPVIAAAKEISTIIHKGSLVVLESTTYPGTTEEVVVPILEESGLKSGQDIWVSYSPERIDPGNKTYSLTNTPKIVGGMDENATLLAKRLYELVVPLVIPVRDCRTAEAVKMLENIYRNVNIALVNEMALIYERMNINIWEVVEAASSKPYGYSPFYPGPGVGGHCIPLDPYYLSFQAKRYGIIPRFIETAGEINDFMRIHVVNLIETVLFKAGRSLRNSIICLCGVTYKKNIADIRESPAIDILELLHAAGALIRICDPYISHIELSFGTIASKPVPEDEILGTDCIVFFMDHSQYTGMNISELLNKMRTATIVDCKNMIDQSTLPPNTIYCGIGKSVLSDT